MWHASVKFHGRLKLPIGAYLDRVRQVLAGVGDPSAGEWPEQGNDGVYHMRRRLSATEQEQLEVRDIRLTPEAMVRWLSMPRQVKRAVPQFIFEEEVCPLDLIQIKEP